MLFSFLLMVLFHEPVPGPFLFDGGALDADSAYVAVDGRIWRVAQIGGTAVPITEAGVDVVSPVISPDGARIAYQRRDMGDVFSLELETGTITRLTYHPGSDRPVTWTPDSRALIFATHREGRAEKLYRQGLPRALAPAFRCRGGVCTRRQADPSALRCPAGAARVAGVPRRHGLAAVDHRSRDRCHRDASCRGYQFPDTHVPRRHALLSG